MSNITKIISKSVEGIAKNKASKCMAFVYQPKVPKNLLQTKRMINKYLPALAGRFSYIINKAVSKIIDQYLHKLLFTNSYF